jgi:hypothetical protein
MSEEAMPGRRQQATGTIRVGGVVVTATGTSVLDALARAAERLVRERRPAPPFPVRPAETVGAAPMLAPRQRPGATVQEVPA